jgi:hypothetical protein
MTSFKTIFLQLWRTSWLVKILLIGLPFFSIGLCLQFTVVGHTHNYLTPLLTWYTAAWVVLSLWLWYRQLPQTGIAESNPRAPLSWSQKGILALTTTLFLFFGIHNLTHFAAVDEPLWLTDRIAQYWHAIGRLEWQKSAPSDKPGVTTVIASGLGLNWYIPKEFRNTVSNGELSNKNNSEVQGFYWAFRLPHFLAIALLLALSGYWLVRLLGPNLGTLAYVFVALSPVTLGMSRIINPDGLLWILTLLTFLSFLVWYRTTERAALLYSGVFFGLVLLTKYVGNLILVFLFGYIVLSALALNNSSSTSNSAATQLRKGLQGLLFFTLTALVTFFVLLPATWVQPHRLLEATLFSQAFVQFSGVFVILVLGMAAFLQVRGGTTINWLATRLALGRLLIIRGTVAVALLSTLTMLAVTYFGMNSYHFIELLESPKSAGNSAAGALGLFLTNFYPTVFAIPAGYLILIGIGLIWVLWRPSRALEGSSGQVFLLGVLFVLVHHLAATASGVAMIVRYQMMLYPLVALMAAIPLYWLWQATPKLGRYFPLILVGTLGSLIVTLLASPYHLSYASTLLPQEYHADVKDMGTGSYEAAQYLNSLPNAKDLTIWTDKDGVCKFWKGRCMRGFDTDALQRDTLDYVVLSSSREGRTGTRIGGKKAKDTNIIPLDDYYDGTMGEPAWKLEVNGRPSQWVKVWKVR